MTTTALQPDRAAAPADPAPARLIAGFAIYLALLVWIVLWKLELPWVGGVDRVIKLVPFIATADQGASKPSEVVINFLLFVPFGVYLGLLVPARRWFTAVGTIAAATMALEATQFVLAIGSTDVTDIVVNTAGGVAGLALVALALRRPHTGRRGILIRLCVVGTVAALLAVALFVASPIQFRPPHGAGAGLEPGRVADSGTVGDEHP